jgi:hypothetical protein
MSNDVQDELQRKMDYATDRAVVQIFKKGPRRVVETQNRAKAKQIARAAMNLADFLMDESERDALWLETVENEDMGDYAPAEAPQGYQPLAQLPQVLSPAVDQKIAKALYDAKRQQTIDDRNAFIDQIYGA